MSRIIDLQTESDRYGDGVKRLFALVDSWAIANKMKPVKRGSWQDEASHDAIYVSSAKGLMLGTNFKNSTLNTNATWREFAQEAQHSAILKGFDAPKAGKQFDFKLYLDENTSETQLSEYLSLAQSVVEKGRMILGLRNQT